MFAMDVWPRERVLSLAPDRASAGQPRPSQTRRRGSTPAPIPTLWGSWTGGESAYQTVVDLELAAGVHLQLPEPEGPVQARACPAAAME